MGDARHVYLLECADGSLYTGINLDVERRYRARLAGNGARYIRSHKPVRLIALALVGPRPEAPRAELAVKRLPRSEKTIAVQRLK